MLYQNFRGQSARSPDFGIGGRRIAGMPSEVRHQAKAINFGIRHFGVRRQRLHPAKQVRQLFFREAWRRAWIASKRRRNRGRLPGFCGGGPKMCATSAIWVLAESGKAAARCWRPPSVGACEALHSCARRGSGSRSDRQDDGNGGTRNEARHIILSQLQNVDCLRGGEPALGGKTRCF